MYLYIKCKYYRSNYISQICIDGHNEASNVAIVVPDFIELTKWLNIINNNTQIYSNEELIINDVVIDKISNEISKYISTTEKGYDKITNFHLILEPFSQENELLTAKMSIRRENIYKKYSNGIYLIFIYYYNITI